MLRTTAPESAMTGHSAATDSDEEEAEDEEEVRREMTRHDCHPSRPSEAAHAEAEAAFPLLAGERVERVGSVEGSTLTVSNYRLHLRLPGTASVSLPLRLIESVESADGIHLQINCKDCRVYKCGLPGAEWLRLLSAAIAPPARPDDLFAFVHYSGGAALAPPNTDSDAEAARRRFERERVRMGLNQDGVWRVSTVNHDYRLCGSYPERLLVPARVPDKVLESIAMFRSGKRVPVVVYRHAGTGAVIARSSQPEVSWWGWRSTDDEGLLQAISEACAGDEAATGVAAATTARRGDGLHNGAGPPLAQHAPSPPPSPPSPPPPPRQPRKLLILDARSYPAAVANRAKGGGCECPEYYPNCELLFMGMANIHSIRKSFHALRTLCHQTPDPSNWLSLLEGTRWLQHLSLLLKAGCAVAGAVAGGGGGGGGGGGRPVLVHCSDGWDRTPQVVALAKLLLDPYYRTTRGFRVLVETEWLDFGHKFAERCGHAAGASDTAAWAETSPVFLQWLDAVHQLARLFPCAFQFSEALLVKLAQHVYACLYGTFVSNTARERAQQRVGERSLSVWSLLCETTPALANAVYSPQQHAVLNPDCHVRSLVLWRAVYLPASVSDSSAAPAPPPSATGDIVTRSRLGRTRSFDDVPLAVCDLPTTVTRQASDPALSRAPPPPSPRRHLNHHHGDSGGDGCRGDGGDGGCRGDGGGGDGDGCRGDGGGGDGGDRGADVTVDRRTVFSGWGGGTSGEAGGADARAGVADGAMGGAHGEVGGANARVGGANGVMGGAALTVGDADEELGGASMEGGGANGEVGGADGEVGGADAEGGNSLEEGGGACTEGGGANGEVGSASAGVGVGARGVGGARIERELREASEDDGSLRHRQGNSQEEEGSASRRRGNEEGEGSVSCRHDNNEEGGGSLHHHHDDHEEEDRSLCHRHDNGEEEEGGLHQAAGPPTGISTTEGHRHDNHHHDKHHHDNHHHDNRHHGNRHHDDDDDGFAAAPPSPSSQASPPTTRRGGAPSEAGHHDPAMGGAAVGAPEGGGRPDEVAREEEVDDEERGAARATEGDGGLVFFPAISAAADDGDDAAADDAAAADDDVGVRSSSSLLMEGFFVGRGGGGGRGGTVTAAAATTAASGSGAGGGVGVAPDGLPWPHDAVQERLRELEAARRGEVAALQRQVQELRARLAVSAHRCRNHHGHHGHHGNYHHHAHGHHLNHGHHRGAGQPPPQQRGRGAGESAWEADEWRTREARLAVACGLSAAPLGTPATHGPPNVSDGCACELRRFRAPSMHQPSRAAAPPASPRPPPPRPPAAAPGGGVGALRCSGCAVPSRRCGGLADSRLAQAQRTPGLLPRRADKAIAASSN